MKRIIIAMILLPCIAVAAAEGRKSVHILPFLFSGTIDEATARRCDSEFRAALSGKEGLVIEDPAATELLSGKLGIRSMTFSETMTNLITKAAYDVSAEDRFIVCGELSGKGAREVVASVFVFDTSERSIVYYLVNDYRGVADLDSASIAKNALSGHVDNIAKLDATIYDWKIKRDAESNNEYVFAVLKKYLPRYADYLRGEDQRSLLKHMDRLQAMLEIPTLFHETTHGLTRVGSSGGKADYPLTPSERIAMKAGKSFPARDIDSAVTEEVRKLFRYSTYIAPSRETQGTQVNGFYGLLDEYNAYNWTLRMIVALYPAFKGEFGMGHPEIYVEYLGDFASELYGVDDFKIFIAWYLKKAQKDDPKLYARIIKDPKIKEMFVKIEDENRRNLDEFDRIRSEIQASFGPRIEFKDGNVMTTGSGNSIFARSLQDAERANVRSILDKEDNAILRKLRE